MKLDNLKDYIEANKALDVTEQLKEKTIQAAQYADKDNAIKKKGVVLSFIQRIKLKRIAIAAACLLIVSSLTGVSILGGFIDNGNPVYPYKGEHYTLTENDREKFSIAGFNENYYYKTASLQIVTFGDLSKSIMSCTNSSYYYAAPNIEGTGGEVIGALLENQFIRAVQENTSTFSIDVDTASYINFRRHIPHMSLADFQKSMYTIRTEEAVNYFDYNYTKPKGRDLIAVNSVIGDCPWNQDSKLAMITLAGKEINVAEQEGSNIVFLIDVSGSMNSPERLPLLKESLKIAINNLNKKDVVSIVTYASGVNTVISGVRATDKDTIIDALESLQSGGSTSGASGLNLAYEVAGKHFIKGGNNRILLATDGDFNVGPHSAQEMKQIVTEKRESGIFLTVLGFGVSYNNGDERLEILADNGNGGYFGIDCIAEGEKVLNKQFTSTLYTIAKDVKIQVEFNSEYVESYRLIGYENRVLRNEEFDDDTVDAGDMGSGHTVTAMYELVLKKNTDAELFSVKVRYKNPDSDKSMLYEHKSQAKTQPGDDFYFAAAVAEACLVINNSQHAGNATLESAYQRAYEYGSRDYDIYKLNFIELLKGIIDYRSATESSDSE